jgi:hypothetical protein
MNTRTYMTFASALLMAFVNLSAVAQSKEYLK